MQHEKPLLNNTIIAALSPAIGRKLAGISYCCVENEASEKDIPDPGFYFGGALRLRFDPEYVVWVTWNENAGWEQAFSVITLTEDTFSEGIFQCFEAHSTGLWEPFVGAALNGFDILGWEGTPSVIRLSFGFGSVLAGIGDQGRYGDGDDVFARPDTGRYLDGKEKLLWSSGFSAPNSKRML